MRSMPVTSINVPLTAYYHGTDLIFNRLRGSIIEKRAVVSNVHIEVKQSLFHQWNDKNTKGFAN